MINIVRETVERQDLLEKGDRVIVALSGGADSCALLRVLLSIREEFDLTIYCAHVNHQLRGEEADRDEAFVRKLTEELKVELYLRHADVKALSEEQKISEELCGRNIRYEFFEELSKKLSAKVATAHTLSDCEETMLFNIARGTSLHGLCSIPYKRDYIIRPLLDVTRQQVEEYMKKGDFPFVNDSTNFVPDLCTRNKIRLSVLPALKEVSDGFDKNFMKLRRKLQSADDFITISAKELLKEAETSFGFDSEKLLLAHDAVRHKALALCLTERGLAPSDKIISLIDEILKTSGAVPLQRDAYAVSTQGIFRITEESREEFSPIPVSDNMEFFYRGKIYTIKKVSAEDAKALYPQHTRLSADSIGASTLIRRREAEDTFSPLKRGVKKRLRKLQNELKIPRELRENALLMAEGSVVLWEENIGVSQEGRPSDETSYYYIIDVKVGGNYA